MTTKAGPEVRSQMRRYIVQRLLMKGDSAPLGDGDLLFTSGRLDLARRGRADHEH
ncbi:hypothetical protein ACFKHW_14730 [Bradyrhizobium lupini]|uniref:hypothetical protein n=1 Tax=Rhizobium lupini TaxID=136996 RepID=UPI0036701713